MACDVSHLKRLYSVTTCDLVSAIWE